MFENQYGSKIYLTLFEYNDITPEYIGWLNDKEVVKFSNQRFLIHTLESSVNYLQSFEGTSNLSLAIKDLSSKQTIGTMTAYISEQHQTVDIGILLGNRDYWGKGIGFDAWSTLVKWASSNYRKVTAGAVAINKPMIALMEKSGMEFEGLKKNHEIVNDCLTDVLFYGKFSDV